MQSTIEFSIENKINELNSHLNLHTSLIEKIYNEYENNYGNSKIPEVISFINKNNTTRGDNSYDGKYFSYLDYTTSILNNLLKDICNNDDSKSKNIEISKALKELNKIRNKSYSFDYYTPSPANKLIMEKDIKIFSYKLLKLYKSLMSKI